MGSHSCLRKVSDPTVFLRTTTKATKVYYSSGYKFLLKQVRIHTSVYVIYVHVHVCMHMFPYTIYWNLNMCVQKMKDYEFVFLRNLLHTINVSYNDCIYYFISIYILLTAIFYYIHKLISFRFKS